MHNSVLSFLPLMPLSLTPKDKARKEELIFPLKENVGESENEF